MFLGKIRTESVLECRVAGIIEGIGRRCTHKLMLRSTGARVILQHGMARMIMYDVRT